MIQPKNQIVLTSQRGKFYIMASHIGCLDDIPPRALAVVQTADLLIFEEDRPARQVLKQAGVQRSYLKFTEHGEPETIAALRTALKAGQTACYMSDQGCALFADPGQRLVALASELKATVRVIPGPSSITAAVMACGFPLGNFFFAGFLPQKRPQRQAAIKTLGARREALIVLDTPYRLRSLLEDLREHFPKGRRGFVALDITGPDEDYLTGSFAELVAQVDVDVKRNFVLIIEAQ